MPRLPGFRRAHEDGEAVAPPPASPRAIRRALPPAGRLRRERRLQLRIREERLRDLGGLVLELHRHDRFREDLVRERCDELGRIDERVAELDALLELAASRSRSARTARCECGAPVFWGTRFCGQCGRAVVPADGKA